MALNCTSGMHCAAGAAALEFCDQEPPYILNRFWAAFVVVLYTRTGFATLAWILVLDALYELSHVIQAWHLMKVVTLSAHPPAETLQVSYPILALLAVLLGLWFVRKISSPVFLEPYLSSIASERNEKLGRLAWARLQVKYSLQLIIVGYGPSYVAFDVAGKMLGPDDKVGVLAVWGALHLLLVLAYWEWNMPESSLLWDIPNAGHRHNQFFGWLALCFVAFWGPIISLAPTGMFSHFRALVGVAAVAVVLAVVQPVRG
jgi:hypothetical protein